MRRLPRSINGGRLEALRQKGVESDLLEARLAFMAIEGVRRYIQGLTLVDRIYPDMLPTQASGRWSTTKPPLVNFPPTCCDPTCALPKPHQARGETSHGLCNGWSARDVVLMDPEWWGLKWDFDGVEARLFSAYAGDEDDIRAFREGLDLHTMTACDVYELPLPPDLRAPHTHPSCAAWRAMVRWEGKNDKRRVSCKNLRYGVLQYGTNEMAASGIRDVEKLGLTREELYAKARALLAKKPAYAAFKRLSWGQAIEQRETRTFLGRKRRFFPTAAEVRMWRQRSVPGEAAKAGLNHRIQGAVADIMNLALIHLLVTRYPEAVLHLNAHDGAMIGFPPAYRPADVLPVVTPIIAREWDVDGHRVPITADGAVVYPDGRSERVKFLVGGTS